MARVYKSGSGSRSPESVDCGRWSFTDPDERSMEDAFDEKVTMDYFGLSGDISRYAFEEGSTLSFEQSAKVMEVATLRRIAMELVKLNDYVRDLRDAVLLTGEGDG